MKIITEFHKILGEKRIKEICDKYCLDKNGRKLVERVLIAWESLLCQFEPVAKTAVRVVGENENRALILLAVLEMNRASSRI